MTGQGFDLVQSATMQVQGIGETVSNQLNCFSFNHIMKPVGMYNQVEQNRKYMLSMGHEVIALTTTSNLQNKHDKFDILGITLICVLAEG